MPPTHPLPHLLNQLVYATLLAGLLKNLKNSANEPVVIEIVANTLLVLSSLCELDTHRKVQNVWPRKEGGGRGGD